MNAQQEMMRILQATNAFYTSPIQNGWELSKKTEFVFATHNVTGISYFFKLNPETKVIKAESWNIDQTHSITLYTGTISLGGRLIAPDMILTLHKLFSFDFASDEVFVVENNRAKKIPPAKAQKKFSIASDDSLAAPKLNALSAPKSKGLWDKAISAVPSRSKFSKFVRRIIYPRFNRSDS
jgi:hypothetical protein